MRVCVTGAAGLLGSDVCAHFREQGQEIIPFALHARNGIIAADLTTPEGIEKIAAESFDALIYCAAFRNVEYCQAHPDRAYALNTQGAIACAKLCAERHVRMIFISTDYVFDSTVQNCVEAQEVNPLNVYGKTKAQAEELLLKAYAQTAVIVRVPLLYGIAAGVEASPLLSALREAAVYSERVFNANARDKRYPTWTGDVARGLLFLLREKSLRGVFHLSAQEALTRYQMHLAFCRALNVSSKNIVSDFSPALRVDRPRDVCLQTQRLNGAGFHCDFVPFEDRIKSLNLS